MKNISKLLMLAVVCVIIVSSLYQQTPEPKAFLDTYNRTFTSDSSDGRIVKYAATYAVAHDSLTGTVYSPETSGVLGQSFSAATYWIWRAYLYFDLTVMPSDANVTSAVLSLNIKANVSATDFHVTIQNGQPTYPHDPLESGDYYHASYSGNGGSRDTAEISSLGYWNITLNSDGRSWLSNSEPTKLALRSSRDISSTPPTGDEYVEVYWAEAGASYTPILYVTYTTEASYSYRLYGAYDEVGYRDGNISVTFYRPTQQSLNFTLDGTYNLTSEADTRMVFHFDLGYNESRIFYVGDQSYMDIYVIKPSEPYYSYYFTVIDYVGITNGYLESLLNINGTDRIVERWRLDVLNDLPFTFSWGVAYKLRVVCDQGTYVFGTYMASATTSFTLVITSSMFPVTATHTGNITIAAGRPQANTIQLNYTDAANLTDWVSVQIYTIRGTSTVYSTNNTGNTHQISWSSADTETDYRVMVIAEHQIRETLTWQFTLAAPETYENPFDFSILGNFPIDSSQIIGMVIVSLVFAAGHAKNAAASIILGLIVTAFLTAINWLDISWAWLTVAFAVGLIAAISIQKDRRRSEQ